MAALSVYLNFMAQRFQFGGTPTLGCQDGLFTLNTLLNAHKNHNLPLFVAFVDFIKAYDTANHDLLLKVLEKYGAPPKFDAAIKTMYTDLKVVLKIDKEITEIMQSVGVRQGDNMAPVLFFFSYLQRLKLLNLHGDKLALKYSPWHTHQTMNLTLAASAATPHSCTHPANSQPTRSTNFSMLTMLHLHSPPATP